MTKDQLIKEIADILANTHRLSPEELAIILVDEILWPEIEDIKDHFTRLAYTRPKRRDKSH